LQIKGSNTGQWLRGYEGGFQVTGSNSRAGLATSGLYANCTFDAANTTAYGFSENSDVSAISGDAEYFAFRAGPRNVSFTAGDTSKLFGFYSNINKDSVSGNNLAYGFYAEGDAPSYYKGLTEHAGGVKVTGGTYATVTNGISGNASEDRLDFTVGGFESLRLERDILRSRIFIDGSSGATTKSGVSLALMEVSGDTAAGQHKYNYIEVIRNSTVNDKFSDIKVLNIPGGAVTGPLNNVAGSTGYGIYSDVGNLSDASVYNFYAAGTAPNYFKGDTFISSSTTIDDFDATNNESKNGAYLSKFGSLLCKVSQDDPNTGYAVFAKKTGLSELSDFRDTIARFAYGKKSNDPAAIATVTYTIRGDGTGGIVANVVSDYRTKENIVDLPSAVDAIKALRPVNYNYTWAPGMTRPGFVAHELQETLSSAVVGTKDATEAIGSLADYDGTVLETEVTEPSAEELTYTEDVTDSEGVTTQAVRTRSWTPTGTRPIYQGVDQTKLIPLLTKALQEVMQKNEDLEARIAALEGA
jgi:hypothetical protein